MAKRSLDTPAGEHPLMSHRTLRAIYAGLASAEALLAAPARRTGLTRAAQADTACWVAPLEDLVSVDIAFDCRTNGLLEHLRPKSHPPILQPLPRLYAAIGAAMTANGRPPQPVAIAFFERHEIDPRHWPEALARAASLPLLLVVLPRWKGKEDEIDLGVLARTSGLPAIPVDAQDPIALYRVAYESILRARAQGGAALIEAVTLPSPRTAIQNLAVNLIDRGVASKKWIEDVAGTKESGYRTQSNFRNAPAKRRGD